MTLEECIAHIPGTITPKMEKYVIEDLFEKRRYIFTSRIGRKQYGYCTYCKTDFETNGFKHGSKEICPNCKSKCIVKASGRGRNKLIDYGYFIYYQKSAINTDCITAVGLTAVRDFSVSNYRGVSTSYAAKSLYVFEPGKGGVAYHRAAYYERGCSPATNFRIWAGGGRQMEGGFWIGNYERAASVKSRFNIGVNATSWTGYCRESITKTIKGTPYRYSTWEKYDIEGMVEFFDAYSKYPCIEYLTKLNLKHLVIGKVSGNDYTCSAINWRGKSVLSVLGIDKLKLREAQPLGDRLSFYVLKLIQMGCEINEAFEIEKTVSPHPFLRIAKRSSIRKTIAYVEKQLGIDEKSEGRKHFYGQHDVFNDWNDYLKDCVSLGFDLSHDNVFFPKDLYRAHQNTIAQVKYKADEVLDQKIKKRADALAQFRFIYRGMIIRPAESTTELIEEGKALHHCVGGYAKRYATGKTTILLLREKKKPDVPFFTMEIQENQIIQCRGLKNVDYKNDKSVKAFVNAFTKNILERPKTEKEAKQA